MKFDNVSIVGVAHVDAPHRIPSEDLDARLAETYRRLGMPARLLESLTGVKARRFWDVQTRPSDAATLAGRKVLADAGVDRARIGALIKHLCVPRLRRAVGRVLRARQPGLA